MPRPLGSGPTAGSFKKGEVTNPKGRPKESAHLRELARTHTEIALNTLVDVAQYADDAGHRVQAACAILDRGYGKPTQGMEISGPEGGPIIAKLDVPPKESREEWIARRAKELGQVPK